MKRFYPINTYVLKKFFHYSSLSPCLIMFMFYVQRSLNELPIKKVKSFVSNNYVLKKKIVLEKIEAFLSNNYLCSEKILSLFFFFIPRARMEGIRYPERSTTTMTANTPHPTSSGSTEQACRLTSPDVFQRGTRGSHRIIGKIPHNRSTAYWLTGSYHLRSGIARSRKKMWFHGIE